MRYKRIRVFVDSVLMPSIKFLKKTRKRKLMPFKEIEALLNIYFPKTKNDPTGQGRYKRVFIIHYGKKKIALKIGRNNKDIRKDHTTYRHFSNKTGTRYFAKIYWRSGIFMLQKYGKGVSVSPRELEKLKAKGSKFGLKDVRLANIMKVGNKFKIVDAERKRKVKNR